MWAKKAKGCSCNGKKGLMVNEETNENARMRPYSVLVLPVLPFDLLGQEGRRGAPHSGTAFRAGGRWAGGQA